MAASRVINQQSFHDGKLVLYQLENRPKRLWLCRIKVPNGTGYIYRGTGTSDLYEARKFAEDLLDEIRIKTKLGHSITGPSLTKMASDFEASARAKGEPTNRDLAIIAFLKTYADPLLRQEQDHRRSIRRRSPSSSTGGGRTRSGRRRRRRRSFTRPVSSRPSCDGVIEEVTSIERSTSSGPSRTASGGRTSTPPTGGSSPASFGNGSSRACTSRGRSTGTG